jgi:hypothetical protein
MTEDLEKTIEEFYERFPNPPNPEHEPKRFAWYVKMFKYFKEKALL